VIACKNSWCVVLAATDGVYCRIHQKTPDLRLVPGLPSDRESGGDPDCKWCDGHGKCDECDGSGNCTCHCGDKHDCEACDGTGRCQECKRVRPKRGEWDKRYLEFAFDVGWRPYDVEADYLSL
jgi:hypothetical protein